MNGWDDGWMTDMDELDEICLSMTVTAPCRAQPLHVAQTHICFGIIFFFPHFFLLLRRTSTPSSEDVRHSYSVKTVSLLL